MILASKALGEVTLAKAIYTRSSVTPEKCFDPSPTVISQYANSPVILSLVDFISQWLCAAAMFNMFYDLVWNLDTAVGYGLDVLGRIVGASRIVNLPDGGTYIGFEGQPTAENWGFGSWYKGATSTNNVRLTDDTYRRVIEAKVLANTWDGSIPEANKILMLLFPGYGNCYMSDDGDMLISYHFGAALSPVDEAIASQEGILPRPCGVAASIVID